jgi:hypothetical protein
MAGEYVAQAPASLAGHGGTEGLDDDIVWRRNNRCVLRNQLPAALRRLSGFGFGLSGRGRSGGWLRCGPEDVVQELPDLLVLQRGDFGAGNRSQLAQPPQDRQHECGVVKVEVLRP